MSQLALFNSGDLVLADDERGRITYRAAFVDPTTADAWFTELRHAVNWRAGRRHMYDREVDVPRLSVAPTAIISTNCEKDSRGRTHQPCSPHEAALTYEAVMTRVLSGQVWALAP